MQQGLASIPEEAETTLKSPDRLEQIKPASVFDASMLATRSLKLHFIQTTNWAKHVTRRISLIWLQFSAVLPMRESLRQHDCVTRLS